MSKAGRNALCPCGSGKKYKKCCLAAARSNDAAVEPRQPFRRAEKPAERRPELSAEERRAGTLCRFERHLRALWTGFARSHERRARRTGLSTIEAVALEGYGYELQWCSEEALTVFTVLCIFSGLSAVGDQADLQASLEATLGRDRAQLYRLFRATPLQVWRCDPASGAGARRGKPLVGPGSDDWKAVDTVIRLGSETGTGVFAAWPIVYDGLRILVPAFELDRDGVTWVREAAANLDEDDGEFWLALHYTIVEALVEPDYEEDDGSIVMHPLSLAERVDPSRVRAFVFNRLEWTGQGSFRVLIARASSADDLEPLIDAARAHRLQALPPIDRMRHVDDPEVEALLSVDEILACFGVGADAELLDRDGAHAYDRQPIALLGLSSELLERAQLDGLMPVRAAADWAARQAEEADRRAVEAAVEHHRLEQRWLATLDASLAVGANLWNLTGYESLMRGFHELFDPAFLETPLKELGMAKAPLGRLEKAWGRLPDGPLPAALGGLPQKADVLYVMKGVGKATITALVEAMFERARTWRQDRSGLDSKRVVVHERRAAEAEDELKGGLEELAALFGS